MKHTYSPARLTCIVFYHPANCLFGTAIVGEEDLLAKPLAELAAVLLNSECGPARALFAEIQAPDDNQGLSGRATAAPGLAPFKALAAVLAAGRLLPNPLGRALILLSTAARPPLTLKRLARELSVERTSLWRSAQHSRMPLKDVLGWVHLMRAVAGYETMLHSRTVKKWCRKLTGMSCEDLGAIRDEHLEQLATARILAGFVLPILQQKQHR